MTDRFRERRPLLLGALDGKVVIGSMNRGGLRGAVFELDDRFTGYDATTIAAMGLDGGKMLTRIDPADPGTAATLEAAGRAITDLSAAAVVRSVAIASGLGATSGYPRDGDVAAAVDAACGLVHGGAR